MPGRCTVTPGGDECALWSPETTVKAHCGLDKSFNMHTPLPADQMHSGSAGGPGRGHSVALCVQPAAKAGRKGAHWLWAQNHFVLCSVQLSEETPLCTGSLRALTNSIITQKKSIHSRSRTHNTPRGLKKWPQTSWACAPHGKVSVFYGQCLGSDNWTSWEKRGFPHLQAGHWRWLLLRERVRGPVPCRFPIWNLCVNY